jgi:hypothetical protein
MSIASLTDARIHRTSAGDRRRRRVHVRAHRGEKAPDRSRTITPLPGANQIARYIPTEAIAIYIGILALFAPLAQKPHTKVWQLDYTSRWYLFAAGLVGTAILVWLVYLGKSRAAGHKGPGRDVPVFEIAMAVLAMAAWAFALPDTPLQDFSWWQKGISPVILTAATLLIPVIASAWGKTPPTYEEAQNGTD